MKRTITSTLLLLLCLASASIAQVREGQDPRLIPPGSRVFIEPMDGFETYIAAAFQKKKVPLVIVATKEAADFSINGNAEMKKAGWAKTIFGSGRPEVNASIQVVNVKTSVVSYAVASHKGDAWKGYKSAAEHIAKNLARIIKEQQKGNFNY